MRLQIARCDNFLKGLLPGHFYSPIPDLHELRKQARLTCAEAVENLAGIELNQMRHPQRDFLQRDIRRQPVK